MELWGIMEIKVKSLGKALAVLECFSTLKPELGISEIAKMTGLYKSSVHNIVSTYVQLGYLEQNTQTQHYYLGLKMLQFSRVVNHHTGLNDVLMPYMITISKELKERVYLGVPHDKSVLYLSSYADGVYASQRTIIGETAPLYCTALGKAVLASLDDAESRLPERLERFTENTITEKTALFRDLELTRARGFAVDDMEHEFGIKCVAVPIVDINHQVLCAISASGPSLRFNQHDIPLIAQIMKGILEPIQSKL